MKKFLLFFVLCIILFAWENSSLNAQTKTKQYNHTLATEEEGGYNIVYINCESDCCYLCCYGGGSLDCTWEAGFEGGCAGCDDSKELFTSGNGKQMWDHALYEISNNDYSGTYNNNFIDTNSGYKYFRTVTWSYNPSTTARTINITITETDEY